MKRIFATFITTLFLLPSLAFAADSPKETVEAMVAKLKESGNPATIVDFVHWKSAFEAVDPQQKQMRNINSPEQLREQYLQLFNNPGVVFREQMDRMKASMPPEQQQMVEAQMGQAEAMLANMMSEMKAKLLKTEFTVGEAKIDGDAAIVKLTTASDGKSESNDLKLIKVEDKWLLSTLDSLEKSAAPTPGGAAPAMP